MQESDGRPGRPAHELRLRPGPRSAGDGRPLRADARRNREQLMAAARDVFVEQGPDAPLDEIARRAGVGIATLYRRFPDRESLMRTVVLDVLGRVGQEARLAQAEEPDALAAIVRYMHRAVDLRIAAVIPALLGQVTMEDEEMRAARDTAARPVQEMIDRAHAEGRLRPDVTFGDIGLMVIRMSRPLPGAFPRQVNEELAHRHVDLLVRGLEPAGERVGRLGGPSLGLGDLRAMSPDAGPGGRPEDSAGPGGRPEDSAGPGGRPEDSAGPGGRPEDSAGPGGRQENGATSFAERPPN